MTAIIYVVVAFYLLWSMLYRFLLEPPGKADVVAYNTLGELEAVLKRVKWVKDGIRQVFDAIGSPEHFQWLINNNQIPKSGRDCDEFAVYCYKVLKTHLIEGVEVVGCMSVNWAKDERGGRGHNVCLLKINGKYAHIGNWGLMANYATLRECIESVLRDRKLRGWAIWQYPWGITRVGSKLPTD
jgi:hypothetical protein